MQQQTITCWMWPEWMIDDSFCVPPLTITQMRAWRFPAIDARDIDVQTPAEERDSRSIWSKRLHFVPSPHNQYSENKVFSHSESSLNDIVALRAAESLQLSLSKLLQELWSFAFILWTRLQSGGILKKMASSCFEEASMMNGQMWMNSLCHSRHFGLGAVVSFSLWKEEHSLGVF